MDIRKVLSTGKWKAESEEFPLPLESLLSGKLSCKLAGKLYKIFGKSKGLAGSTNNNKMSNVCSTQQKRKSDLNETDYSIFVYFTAALH